MANNTTSVKIWSCAVGQLGDQINNVFKKAGEILDNNPIAIPIVAVGIVAAGGIAVLLLLGVNLTAKSGKHSISAEGRSAGKTSTGANVSYGKAKAGITGAV
ncbi:MAG: hypothetical protein FWH37_09055 [Candidatus Bathyarchaeota archaeon]|nr:hypothetical protein [Candidatus Termiticorpusculum sp.]